MRGVGDDIDLPRNDLTVVDGHYGLWFGKEFEHHALIGPVVSLRGARVTRRVLKTTAPISSEPFEAHWTGHIMSGPGEIDPDWTDVTVPLCDGAAAPAWLLHGKSLNAPWVIHVQGIRTSRLVALRSVDAAASGGLTSLVITYRGSGDGPHAGASMLGQCEWRDLADAVAFARSQGATAVYVVAWSMAAGLALNLLQHDPTAFDRLALIAPATDWRAIIRHGVHRARLPRIAATAVMQALGSRKVSRWLGLAAPLDFESLDWLRRPSVEVPTVVVHSAGDEEIPFSLSRRFLSMNGDSVLVETIPAPHGWEANVDSAAFDSALATWLE
ncbi:alpha/beta hydrolase [Microbacterium jejuense]|uniref:alpha/beta hydrolase family protein n=1 Tax=Microbacterium jejuense TaxID=1263637 RepID=UPI0031ECE9FE